MRSSMISRCASSSALGCTASAILTPRHILLSNLGINTSQLTHEIAQLPTAGETSRPSRRRKRLAPLGDLGPAYAVGDADVGAWGRNWHEMVILSGIEVQRQKVGPDCRGVRNNNDARICYGINKAQFADISRRSRRSRTSSSSASSRRGRATRLASCRRSLASLMTSLRVFRLAHRTAPRPTAHRRRASVPRSARPCSARPLSAHLPAASPSRSLRSARARLSPARADS